MTIAITAETHACTKGRRRHARHTRHVLIEVHHVHAHTLEAKATRGTIVEVVVVGKWEMAIGIRIGS
jgi:hypothetical protein